MTPGMREAKLRAVAEYEATGPEADDLRKMLDVMVDAMIVARMTELEEEQFFRKGDEMNSAAAPPPFLATCACGWLQTIKANDPEEAYAIARRLHEEALKEYDSAIRKTLSAVCRLGVSRLPPG